MATYCLEKFNQNGDLATRKCIIGSTFQNLVEQEHPGFTVSKLGESDDLNLCQQCPLYPTGSGLSEQDVKVILRAFVDEVLEEIRKNKIG